AAGLATDDEQRAVEIARPRNGEHGARVGAVEHGRGRIREARGGHLRREARPAHPAHDGAVEAVTPRRVGETHQIIPLCEGGAWRGPPCQTVHTAAKLNALAAPGAHN